MTNNWFECKVSYEKTLENGLTKKVAEPYVIDAMSYAEAEERIIEEMQPFMSGEFSISGIKEVNFSDIFFNEKDSADLWFKCKLSFITLDERTGAEKRSNCYMLVQASDIRDAIKCLDEQMKGTISDYIIASVTETKIVDVYPYKAE